MENQADGNITKDPDKSRPQEEAKEQIGDVVEPEQPPNSAPIEQPSPTESLEHAFDFEWEDSPGDGHYGSPETWTQEADDPVPTETLAPKRWLLRSQPPSLSPLSDEPIDRWAETLLEQRIVLVSCAHPRVLISAMWHLLGQERLSSITERVVSLTSLLSSIAPRGVSGGGEELLVLAAHEGLEQVDEDSLGVLTDEFKLSHIQKLLLAFSRYIVVIASDRALQELKTQDRSLAPTLHRWRVAFVRPFLEGLCDGDEKRAARLAAKLKVQRAAGHWPVDDSALYDALAPFEEVVELELALRREVCDEAHEPPVVEDCPEGLRDAVLWVATYLRHLPASDFQIALETLLGERREPLVILPPSSEGEEPPVPPEPRLLRDVWQDVYRQAMPKLGLTFTDRPDDVDTLLGAQRTDEEIVVDFIQQGRRAVTARYFERLAYFDHLNNIECIKAQGLLFHGSEMLVDRVVRFIVAIARKRPIGFGRKWLVEIALTAGDTPLLAASNNPAAQQLEQLFIQLSQARHLHFLTRLCRLMRAMYGHGSLREMVHGFLSELLVIAPLQSVTLDIVERMFGVLEFDGLYWLRQLIDRGQARVADRARRIAYGQLRSGHTSKHLAALADWVPLSREELPQLGTSGRFAVEAFLALLEASIDQGGRGDIGARPPNNIVLSAMYHEGPTEADTIDRIVRWLLHPTSEILLAKNAYRHLGGYVRHRLLLPEVRACLGPRMGPLEQALFRRWAEILDGTTQQRGSQGFKKQAFAGILLVDWAIILEGDAHEPVPAPLLDELLHIFVNVADDARMRRVILCWNTLEACLLDIHQATAQTMVRRDLRRSRSVALRRTKGMRRRTAALRRQLAAMRRTERIKRN